MAWGIIFWLAVISIIHSYLIFPLFLKLVASFRQPNRIIFNPEDPLPEVSIIMAAHNEEAMLEEKLISIFQTNYPKGRFELLVGSDCSTDRTDEILEVYSGKHPALHVYRFDRRQGKPSIINRLHEHARGEILILTDANVYFREDTLFNLVRHFKNREIGLVAGNIVNTRTSSSGVSIPEWTFLSREIRIKHYEGRIWGTTIGAEGGCYAIRKDLYSPVPGGFAVDDFYITMKVLEQGFRCILSMEAIVYEDVSSIMGEAFRRKVRISSGNFLNLEVFKKLLWPPFSGRAFSFFSHKVLRWFGPFSLVLMLFTNLIIFSRHPVYKVTLFVQLGLYALVIIDYLLRKIRFDIVLLRFIAHFYSMNLALLLGFFKYLTGSETHVWEPTKRKKDN